MRMRMIWLAVGFVGLVACKRDPELLLPGPPAEPETPAAMSRTGDPSTYLGTQPDMTTVAEVDMAQPVVTPPCGRVGEICCDTGLQYYCDEGFCLDQQYCVAFPDMATPSDLTPPDDLSKPGVGHNCHDDQTRHDAGERNVPTCEDPR